ncbi:MAG: hypothetical protein AB1679_09760 [Actinomycetota bacterium]
MVRMLRRVLRLSLLAGIGVGILKAVKGRKAHDPWAESWVSTGAPGATRPSPAPVAPAPPKPAAPAPRATKPTRTGPARKSPTGKAEDPPGERLWVPANDGVCPPSHPIKAKLSSKIFHTPASRNYSRTKADRCYPDEASAQADGLRPPQH